MSSFRLQLVNANKDNLRFSSLISWLAACMCVLVLPMAAKASPRADAQLGPGTYHQTIRVLNLTREFIVHIPPSYQGARTPLVFNFHGGGSTDLQQQLITHMDLNADKNGYIVVYPNSVSGHWNTLGGAEGTHYPDIAFVLAMLKYLPTELSIDPHRIYSCGFSDGSLFTQRLAFVLPDRLAAVALVEGELTVAQYNQYAAARTKPIPFMFFMADTDPIVPFNGGPINDFGTPSQPVFSALFTAQFWAQHNKCASTAVSEDLPNLPFPCCSSVRNVYKAATSHGEDVVFWQENGSGHTWPQGLQYQPVSVVGKVNLDIDANEAIWQFLSKYSLPH